MHMLSTIVSGGQTGVDRAALDVAIQFQISHSGWCPRGRRAEDGVIGCIYQLKETESDGYEERTLLNIRDSSATLILIASDSAIDSIRDGTILTIQELNRLSKPYIVIEVSNSEQNNEKSIEKCMKWLSENKPKVLNIAGPRESTTPGIYAKSFLYLSQLLTRIKRID